MKKLLRNLIPVFLFFGILTGCETTDPIIDEAQVNIYTQNFDSAYASLDRYIAQNPESGIGHYYKALAYSQEGGTIQPPSDRKPVYRNFRESILTSRELFADAEEKPDEAGQVNDLILNTWGFEHNASLDYATNDSVMASVNEPLKVAIAHLENAIIINPDSTLSYDVLSQIHFMDNNFEQAAEVLAQSMELKDPPPAEDYDRIGYYYAQSGETESAIEILNEGLEIYPDSTSLVQKLADAYMTSDNTEMAISTLNDLIDREPDNPQYHLVLGTALLSETEEMTNAVSDLYDDIYALRNDLRNASRNEASEIESQIEELENQIQANIEEINELNSLAESELKTTIELRPEDENAYNALGVLYQNKGAILFSQRNYSDDLDEVNRLDQQAKEFYRMAMENYEKTVELNPENRNAWQSLANVYITLDMQDKYEEAIEKAGM
ncbi:MAG: tetratricopeptide repeat protein [Gracilimonas sp.]|uniref:tetratricopeptide repeat protein n=1 Tax=Gracilimonas sp. TaxID=1974203 RepID=UPI0037518BEB|nr:tetratricopeptide repeat protein [Gracilimonas sp.]